ncbi:vacuolar iron transporter homolog 4-like [Prosopis cineraria]|uniref:vacuolar iron transporter homolog 4-like n=1 Tax=Prosopis cineraria TaxID=364024 RepID=UPI00240F8117|nr:vacuolar iron transporter homolog 4-like [Prosopis cineraria]
MASHGPCVHVSLNQVGAVPNHADEKGHGEEAGSNNFDYSQRGQWLRAAVLGANDGLVSIASLMMGVGAVKEDVRAMLLAGFAGTVAGACSMAIGEFVSVYTQYDVEIMQMERDQNDVKEKGLTEKKKKKLPNPFQAALASAFSFFVGALVPLLAAAFITNYKVRLMVIVLVSSSALVVFGGLGSILGKTPVVRSCLRVLVGGWIAMAITFGLTKSLDSGGVHL